MHDIKAKLFGTIFGSLIPLFKLLHSICIIIILVQFRSSFVPTDISAEVHYTWIPVMGPAMAQTMARAIDR